MVRYPKMVILSTDDFVSEFRNFVVSQGRSYWFVEDMIQEIIKRINWSQLAVLRVEELAKSIEKNNFEYDFDYVEDIYAPFVKKLGLLIVDSIKKIGLYESNGSLHYRMTVTGNTHFNDVVLSRREDRE